MHLIEDTRQKVEKHKVKNEWWKKNGDKVLRCKLPFGDYALPPKISVDTKEDMLEIAKNIDSQHIRFREECKLAKEYGCQLIILVENEDGIMCVEDVKRWKNPRIAISPKAITGERMYKSMKTMSERYGVRFEFCTPQESARRVKELLADGQK